MSETATDNRAINVVLVVDGQEFTVQTHIQPHADEIFGMALVHDCADKAFVAKYAPKRFLQIGIGGGRFDEHAKLGRKDDDKRGHSACSLVARDLGVQNDPAIKKLLDYVTMRDGHGNDTAFGLYTTINLLMRSDPTGERTSNIIDWAITGFGAKIRDVADRKQFDIAYIGMLLLAEAENELARELAHDWLRMGMEVHAQQRRDFFKNTADEFAKKAQISKIMGPHDQIITLVSITTDDPHINAYARSHHGAQADIIVVRRSNGHNQIFTDRRSNLLLHELVAMLRYEEQRLAGKFVVTDWKQLRVVSKAYEGDIWFHMEQGQTILNGCHTAPNVPGSAIPLAQIVEFIKVAMALNDFNPDYDETHCRAGKCFGKTCPWYAWGLTRCSRVRAEQHSREN